MIKLINALGASLDLPVTMSWTRVPATWSVPSARLVHGDGAVPTGRATLEPRRFELVGSIYDVDPAMIRSQFDTIVAFLQHRPLQVFQHHDDDRFIVAHPMGYPQDWIDARRELELRIPMIALDPYFYGETETEEEQIASSPHQWSLDVGGTTATYPTVTFRFGAQVENPLIVHLGTGEALAFEGIFQPGETLMVDTARFVATLDDGCVEERVLDLADPEWLISGFRLHPGANPLVFQCVSGSPALAVEMSWRPRYF